MKYSKFFSLCMIGILTLSSVNTASASSTNTRIRRNSAEISSVMVSSEDEEMENMVQSILDIYVELVETEEGRNRLKELLNLNIAYGDILGSITIGETDIVEVENVIRMWTQRYFDYIRSMDRSNVISSEILGAASNIRQFVSVYPRLPAFSNMNSNMFNLYMNLIVSHINNLDPLDTYDQVPYTDDVEYDFGIITSRGNNRTLINYYTLDGELVRSSRRNLSSIGGMDIVDTGDILYAHINRGDIFAFNKQDGTHEIYNFDHFAYNIDVNDPFIYTTDLKSAIVYKFNTLTGEIKEFALGSQQLDIQSLYVYENNIYLFVRNHIDVESSLLYIIDTELTEIKNIIDISEISTIISDMHGFENKIYLANNRGAFSTYLYDSMTREEVLEAYASSNVLSEYNIDTREFNHYILDTEYPLEIFEYGNTLIITHNNGVVTLFDLITKEHYPVELQNTVHQAIIHNNMFISLDITTESVYIYSLPDFELVSRNNISMETHNQRYLWILFSR